MAASRTGRCPSFLATPPRAAKNRRSSLSLKAYNLKLFHDSAVSFGFLKNAFSWDGIRCIGCLDRDRPL